MKAFFLALLTLFQLLPILPPASETQTPADQGASVFRLELDGLAAAELVDGQPIQVPEPAKLALESPQNHQVFQRHSATEGVVRVSGRAPDGTEKVEFSTWRRIAAGRARCARRHLQGASEGIRAAQAALWSPGVALAGPDTDKLIGDQREKHGRGVHFSRAGLIRHGEEWAAKVAPWVEQQLAGRR